MLLLTELFIISYTIQFNMNHKTRNLCIFTSAKKVMKIIRFLVFLCISVNLLHAQQVTLSKFTQQCTNKTGDSYTCEGMIDNSGQIIIPADYDYIWEFGNDSLTLARKINLSNKVESTFFTYQIISHKGFLYYEFPSFYIPEPIQENLLRTYNDRIGSFGFLNSVGEVVISFKYPEARDFKENLAAVLDPKSYQFGYINSKGKFQIKPQFEEAFSFSEGQAVVKKNGKFHYLLKDGSLLSINKNYTQIFDIQEGYSIVTAIRNDTLLYGIIDKTGKEIIAPCYTFIDNFESGSAVFIKNNLAGMLNNKGEVIIEPKYDELYRFDQEHYLFEKNGLKGLLSIDGKPIVPATYSAIDLFHEGIAAVNKSEKWGFIDIQGNEIIPCQFSEYKNGFNNGSISVRLPNQWNIIHSNDTLNLPNYDEVLPFYRNTAAFRKGNLWGFLNLQGEESIEPKFEELVFNKGGGIFGKVGKSDGSFIWSYIDYYGREIQVEKYKEIVKFTEGLAAVETKEGWGFINLSGTEIVRPQYDYVRNYSSGLAAVNKNGEWGFINKEGIEELPVFEKMPVFEDEIPKTFIDSLNNIRESFPLYKMEIISDFNNSSACVEDRTLDNSTSEPLLINKKGKIIGIKGCTPFIKNADAFMPDFEINPDYQLISIPNKWLNIDRQGNVIIN